MQLTVKLFNEGNSYIIYTFKLLCLFVTISCGFAAIACFGFNNVQVMFSTFLFSDVMFIYSVVYEKAFAIPDGVAELKSELLVAAYGKRMKLG